MLDSFQRRIDYLRLSVTDRCNLRCVYCVPDSRMEFNRPEEIIRYEEIVRLVHSFSELSVSKIRVTGGEPLVRTNLCELIREMSRVKGISDIALSTNGLQLGRLAGRLRESGVNRVNISLDTLNPDKFRTIARRGRLEDVLNGITASLQAGFYPVKINVVVARGMNEEEIVDFARMTEDLPVHVRFIELMPMGESHFYSEDRRVPLAEMLEQLPSLIPLPSRDRPAGHGPGHYFRVPGAQGTVGFIGALSHRFCSSCNRLRLSSTGVLYPCLDSTEGEDLLTPLRNGAGDEDIKDLIRRTVQKKPAGHTMMDRIQGGSARKPVMCRIGG